MILKVIFREWGASPWRKNVIETRENRGVFQLVMPGAVENYRASEILCVVRRA